MGTRTANTKFQRTLKHDKETLWKIVKIFHPDIPDTIHNHKKEIDISVKDELLSAYSHYTWVCIDFRVKGYGSINIGIDNHHNVSLYGAGITKQNMADAIKAGSVSFRVWRFCTDKLGDSPEERTTRETLSDKAVEIIKEAGYQLIEVDEWYKDYYSD